MGWAVCVGGERRGEEGGGQESVARFGCSIHSIVVKNEVNIETVTGTGTLVNRTIWNTVLYICHGRGLLYQLFHTVRYRYNINMFKKKRTYSAYVFF